MVAASTRMSTRRARSAPIRWISPDSSTRSSLAWASSWRSPISSRKSVPPSATSNLPIRRSVAPVNEPFSWPNISLSTRSLGMAAQLTETNGPLARPLCRWIAVATSSLPVPESPRISTRASVSATCSIAWRTRSIAREVPTRVGCGPSWARSARFSAWVRTRVSAERTATSSDSGASGFSRNWNAPLCTARTASESWALPLIMITGMSASVVRIFSRVARPSGPGGIIRSRRIRSGFASGRARRPALPLGASATSNPSDLRRAPTIRRMFASSSMIRMRVLMLGTVR